MGTVPVYNLTMFAFSGAMSGGAIGRHTRRSGSVSSVVYAGLYFSSAGRRANDEFCTYHIIPKI